MPDASPGQVTGLLHAWSVGQRDALDQLIELLYPELRRLARQAMRGEQAGSTLQTTAVIHEAYLRMVHRSQVEVRHRNEFFAVAALTMRRVLVDQARRRRTKKRSALPHVAPDEDPQGVSLDELIELDRALDGLAEIDSRQARIVELRYFGGLTVEETAAVLEISRTTVKREWAMARAWLYRKLNPELPAS